MEKGFVCVALPGGFQECFPAVFFSKNRIFKTRIRRPEELKPGDKIIYLGTRKQKNKVVNQHGWRADKMLIKKQRYSVVNNNNKADEVLYAHVN